MILRPPRSTRTDTLLPYTTLFRSKHIGLKADGVVYRDVVLDFHIVANDDIVGDEDVLPKRAARTDAGPRTDMRPVPDARPLADRRTRIDNGGFMNSHSARRSEEHTSELQSLMRNSYGVFCLKKKKKAKN